MYYEFIQKIKLITYLNKHFFNLVLMEYLFRICLEGIKCCFWNLFLNDFILTNNKIEISCKIIKK